VLSRSGCSLTGRPLWRRKRRQRRGSSCDRFATIAIRNSPSTRGCLGSKPATTTTPVLLSRAAAIGHRQPHRRGQRRYPRQHEGRCRPGLHQGRACRQIRDRGRGRVRMQSSDSARRCLGPGSGDKRVCACASSHDGIGLTANPRADESVATMRSSGRLANLTEPPGEGAPVLRGAGLGFGLGAG
jgi:hypothetical protein